MNNNDRTAAIVEAFDAKLDMILEILKPICNDVAILKVKAEKAEADIQVIKAAVTDTSKQVNTHERLLAKLKPTR